MVDFSDRLDRYLRQPKDITGFTLTNSNILKDIKVSFQLYIHIILVYNSGLVLGLKRKSKSKLS